MDGLTDNDFNTSHIVLIMPFAPGRLYELLEKLPKRKYMETNLEQHSMAPAMPDPKKRTQKSRWAPKIKPCNIPIPIRHAMHGRMMVDAPE